MHSTTRVLIVQKVAVIINGNSVYKYRVFTVTAVNNLNQCSISL